MGTRGDPGFDRPTALVEPRGIPVIGYNNYFLRQGAVRWRDATCVHNGHWNATGHRWAAEVLLEYLKRNQEICTMRKSPPRPPIARIRTGQFTPDCGQIWQAEFPVAPRLVSE